MTSYSSYWGLYRCDDEETPQFWRWKRRVYERVFHPVWPHLLAGLEPVLPDGRFAADVVLARVPQAAEALADQTIPVDQETLLDAINRPFTEEVGPIERGCACTYCRKARNRPREEAQVPREARLRRIFVSAVIGQIETLVDSPNSHDRRHGLPPLIRRYRHRLSHRGGNGS
jgi:hypothetical protein